MKQRVEVSKTLIDYFIEKATNLSLPYESQYKALHMIGDYLTEDIANDWMLEDLKGLNQMYDNGLISEDVLNLYKEIDNNFCNTSKGGGKYEASIWTLKGLESHPFWEKQRNLAKEILIQLKKIHL